jgi:hypothetical protein
MVGRDRWARRQDIRGLPVDEAVAVRPYLKSIIVV